MLLCLPVVDGHDLTKAVLDSLQNTVTGNSFKVAIFDNASDKPYVEHDYIGYDFPVTVIHSDVNLGYYAPLGLIAENYKDELIGLAHNDLVYYERGWNERMEHSFAMDQKLGLVGLCGSNEIDNLGGRGGGTVCYFRGDPVQVGKKTIIGQSQDAGRRTTDLIPSACLDSLFMMFRREAISDMEQDWVNLPLAHFIDRIWPCRLVQAGWHVATLGVESDHLGGMTTTGNQRYADDCAKWLEERNLLGVRHESPETSMYLIAEDRYFAEFKDTFFPCRVNGDYTYEKL